jgi:hypothetical protein
VAGVQVVEVFAGLLGQGALVLSGGARLGCSTRICTAGSGEGVNAEVLDAGAVMFPVAVRERGGAASGARQAGSSFCPVSPKRRLVSLSTLRVRVLR